MDIHESFLGKNYNPNDNVQIEYSLTGPVFERGIPLHILLSSMDNFQNIIDKTYLGLQTDRRKITKDIRENYYLETKSIYHKSLHSILDIVMIGQQATLPILGYFGPKGIWEITKESFKFLKLVFEFSKSGKRPEYSFSTEGVSSKMDVTLGDKTYSFNQCVFNIGQDAVPFYQNLAGMLAEKKIDSISMAEKDENSIPINLSLKDKKLFEIPSTVEDLPLEIECEIFDFNKHKKNGKLTISSESRIPTGDYNFDLIGDQDIIPYIEAMLKQTVNITCLKENAVDPFGKPRVTRLQIINVK